MYTKAKETPVIGRMKEQTLSNDGVTVAMLKISGLYSFQRNIILKLIYNAHTLGKVIFPSKMTPKQNNHCLHKQQKQTHLQTHTHHSPVHDSFTPHRPRRSTDI